MMIRILQYIGSLDRGGSQSMIMNYYRKIDRSVFQFDFIIDRPNEDFYVDEIKRLGGFVYVLPSFKGTNYIQFVTAWKNFFQEHHEYSIIHGHVRSTASIYLKIAKKYGLITISHSHSTANGSGFASIIKYLLQKRIRYIADFYISCSEKAGVWLFGEKTVHSLNHVVLKNAIDLSEYTPADERRSKIRSDMECSDDLVFGHVGRLCKPKNHSFLLQVFNEIHRKEPHTKLLIIGDGELKHDIEAQVKELKLDDAVIMTGMRSDVPELLQAVDVFLFPSAWEGLPVTVIEAQAAGLPCLISDAITNEVCISELVQVLPIDQGTGCWVSAALKKPDRNDVRPEIIKAGFSIDDAVEQLANIYTTLYAMSKKAERGALDA
jgi:glycosyltransferase involved in cell wall biosynthesis